MIEEFNTEQYEIAIEEVRDLHGNMSVLSRLYAILSDPNSRISEAVELLQSDGALSAIILRFSNGALFSPNERSDSIEMALQQVGFQKTLKLVGAALSKQVFMRNLNAYGITADSYWRYSYFNSYIHGKTGSHLRYQREYGLSHRALTQYRTSHHQRAPACQKNRSILG